MTSSLPLSPPPRPAPPPPDVVFVSGTHAEVYVSPTAPRATRTALRAAHIHARRRVLGLRAHHGKGIKSARLTVEDLERLGVGVRRVCVAAVLRTIDPHIPTLPGRSTSGPGGGRTYLLLRAVVWPLTTHSFPDGVG